MAKGYSARGGFSGGGSAMRQQQMQQKLLKMQQDMAAAQEEVENASFTASVGGGVVQATVSGKKELTALTVKPEAVDPEDVEMLQDLVISAVNEALRQADEAMNSSMQSFTGGLPVAFAMETTSIGRFCHGQHGFWRFHRQCAFRHVLLSPAHLFGTICHGRYVFPVLLVIVNMGFRRCLGSLEHYFVCFLPIVWIFSTSSIFILTSKTAAAKGCPLGTAVLFTPFSA